MQLAARLPASCYLVFTTAYARYALDGFEVDAVDFLHKPFFYDCFSRAVQKAEQWMVMHSLQQWAESGGGRLLLKADYKNVTVPFHAILYIEAVDNYVRVVQENGAVVQSKIPLHRVEEQLPAEEFVRIHRSFIVARFSRSEVVLRAQSRHLPVGRKYAAEAVRKLERETEF
ncbi:MAG: LytTR family DNA-binding domain-containing protein [Bacteroidales bacterium]|nr:LytTR family DNA-binding domain-containing protein [Bacteroidales bacterium]